MRCIDDPDAESEKRPNKPDQRTGLGGMSVNDIGPKPADYGEQCLQGSPIAFRVDRAHEIGNDLPLYAQKVECIREVVTLAAGYENFVIVTQLRANIDDVLLTTSYNSRCDDHEHAALGRHPQR
ncbi:hypothetical protein SAE02_03460 [Skermanella aerolata]|uniref:Uncharacterized protein n=1 Tax=Skermanella aerolata TaxID=393310 RepID=A0A512DI88_9PROT|nr:hypothetical protein SAE02_03460 [Skermanella aerolata]